MKVLVDTTIWSLALRRARGDLSVRDKRLVQEWRRLVSTGDAVLIGPLRQELLSGIRDARAFDLARDHLRHFDHLEIELDDYDLAASFSNVLQSKGVAATAVDSLVCAMAYRWQMSIFTTDIDFDRYSQHLPISLHQPRET